MGSSVEVQALTKLYARGVGRREIRALDGVSFRVEPGELFGLLGPNGAGKTTAVKILLGLTHPTGGEARLQGLSASDPASRRRVGYLPEGHRFPGYLTARETLRVFGKMSGMSHGELARRVPELLARVKLGDWADVRVRKFSKGMTQRLGLAAALVHDPEVLLLDEPTDGVDPVGRREIRDLLREEAARGKAILLNSHLLSEIELTCDRVAVLQKGRLAAIGTIEELTAGRRPGDPENASKGYKLVASGLDEATIAAFRATGAGAECVNGHVRLTARDLRQLNELVDLVRSRGALLVELTPERNTLEDVFVDLVRAADPAGNPLFSPSKKSDRTD